MKKTKEQKGITLIALIITIVVLLILVGVTIGTLDKSNIIGKAKDAAESFNQAKGKEIVSITDIEATLNKYTQGVNVEDKNDLEDLKKYLLGSDGEGRDLAEIYDEDGGFKQDPKDSESVIHTKLKAAQIEIASSDPEIIVWINVRYNRTLYKFKASIELGSSGITGARSIKDSLVIVKTLENNLGKYVKYANNTWIVLTDDDSGVELISANALGSINFISSSVDEARKKYNDVINSLVSKCKEETGITTNIRSVGSYITNEEQISNSNTVTFKDLNTFTPRVEYSEFAKFEGETNGFRKDNLDYETDYNKMLELGILEADNGIPYWLASRFVYEHNDARSSYINFKVRYISSGIVLEQTFCTVGELAGSDIAYGCDEEDYRAVRPIVMLNSGILDGFTQSGEFDDPIILD